MCATQYNVLYVRNVYYVRLPVSVANIQQLFISTTFYVNKTRTDGDFHNYYCQKLRLIDN